MAPAVVAAYVAAAAAAVGAGVTAYSAYEQGQQQKKVAEANARMAEYEAKQARDAAEVRASQYRKEADRRMATMRAGFMASGAISTEGTPLLVLMESAEEAAVDELRIKRGGEQSAWGLLQEANLQRLAGQNASTRGYLGAGSSLLGGAARVAGSYGKWGK